MKAVLPGEESGAEPVCNMSEAREGVEVPPVPPAHVVLNHLQRNMFKIQKTERKKRTKIVVLKYFLVFLFCFCTNQHYISWWLWWLWLLLWRLWW